MPRWIPLARVAREHGLTKGETSYLKCDLLQVGGLAFQSATAVAIVSEISGSALAPDSLQAPQKILKINEPIKPLGGKWGQAKAVILPVPKNFAWTRGEWVLVPREAFPKLAGGEVYLCDLMGRALVASPGDLPAYTVIGIEDRSRGSVEALSLILRDAKSHVTFEAPVRAIDWAQSTDDVLVMPAIEDWRSLV